jgi:hypothetical protein
LLPAEASDVVANKMASVVRCLMTIPCFPKWGKRRSLPSSEAVNTLLTPTTMGGEKFHITVTIDNEKGLENADFLAFSLRGNLLSRNIPTRHFLLQFFCHVQPLRIQRRRIFIRRYMC